MIKVLLSAYACEPGKGSEPGVGWQWACGLADKVELTVVTRRNNQRVIEEEIQKLPDTSPIKNVKFVYFDLGGVVQLMKRNGLISTNSYYILWQWFLALSMSDEIQKADIIHHLTFCSPLCPGFWPSKSKRVIGPVGAPLVNPHYLNLFGKGAWVQMVRTFVLKRLMWLPWLRKAFLSASAVIPANTETMSLLEKQGVICEPIILDTGVSSGSLSPATRSHQDGGCRFLYAGTLVRRKGLEMAIRAFAQMLHKNPSASQNCTFTILGNGPDWQRLKGIAEELKVGDRILFAGAVPQAKVNDYLLNSDVFVFPSVRDTSAGVNLEAMSCGLPILCIAHQGVADLTNDSCALRIPPGTISNTIDALAKGMKTLAFDASMREQLGVNARKRAISDFAWSDKFERMISIYDRVYSRKDLNQQSYH
jgi:glycosyltransferase involved in cell wall biosynthesis